MKGCFRMCYVVHYDDDKTSRIKQEDGWCCAKDFQRDVFIPKKLVVAVQKYESFSQHLDSMSCSINEKDASQLHYLLCSVFKVMGVEMCSCMSESEYWGDDTMDPKCKGIERLYPLYEVRVKNLYPEKYDGKVLPVCSYYLHSCEREHMERFLAGTDDPMYDFVHELRYNPRFLGVSPDLETARENFDDERKKRIKR